MYVSLVFYTIVLTLLQAFLFTQTFKVAKDDDTNDKRTLLHDNTDLPVTIHKQNAPESETKHKERKKTEGKANNQEITPLKLDDDKRKDDEETVNKGNINIIPFIYNRQDGKHIKQSIDNFKMVRRKTHFVIPDVNTNNYENQNYFISKRNDLQKELNNDKICVKNTKKDYSFIGSEIYKKRDVRQEKIKEFGMNSKMLKILRTQSKLMSNFLSYLQSENYRKNEVNDFDVLIEELHNKTAANTTKDDNLNMRITAVSAASVTRRASTRRGVLDAASVREALRQDALVMAVLRRAKRRRERYLSGAKPE